MNTIFADTGYWIALYNPRDQLHERSLNASALLEGVPIVTTQMILTEFLNYFAPFGAAIRAGASRVVEHLERNSLVEIVPQTAKQFQEARLHYSKREDQAWSLTDCASFVLMRQRGIREALAYDHHFEQAGFIPLLRNI